MFTLVADRGKYYRVKNGQSVNEVQDGLVMPVAAVFAGEIVERNFSLTVYKVKPMESYASLARKFGVQKEELEKLNFSRPLYPAAKLFVPCQNKRVSI